MSMASKEAVADVLDGDFRPEVAVSFGTILQRLGRFSISSSRDFLRLTTLAYEMSAVVALFTCFGPRMQRATSKLADAIDTE